MTDAAWAVVDVETTGLHPVRDRIVEIAIIRLDADAVVVDEWVTLVDPEGRAPGTHIHGLTARDLQGAPRWRDVLDNVLALLSGRVIVAHNAPFDVGFLQAETVRAGVAWGPVEGLCTMAVTQGLHLAKARQLHLCCEELGLPIGADHSAINDARAVAGIMGYLAPRLWTLEVPEPAPAWPEPAEPSAVRQRSARAPATTGVERHLTGMPIPSGLPVSATAAATYLGLLDRVVEDRRVTAGEVDALGLFADACGITRDVARRLHTAYLDEMWRVAREDALVTSEERADLETLAALLGGALPR